MSSDIDHIVFDIGRVLLHWDAELIYVDRIPDAEKRRWFLANICTPKWNLDRDRGSSFSQGEAELIAEYPKHAENIKAFQIDWHLSIPHAIDGTPQIMNSLIESGKDVTMLTNFSAETYPRAVQKYDFLEKPRGVTVSGEVGLLKPDGAIYELHQRTFDLDPAKTLFIDDSEKNVNGAIDFGWGAVLFENAKTLKADLKRFAIVC